MYSQSSPRFLFLPLFYGFGKTIHAKLFVEMLILVNIRNYIISISFLICLTREFILQESRIINLS